MELITTDPMERFLAWWVDVTFEQVLKELEIEVEM